MNFFQSFSGSMENSGGGISDLLGSGGVVTKGTLDKELRCILKKLDLSSYANNFSSSNIVYKNLDRLSDSDLEKLIPNFEGRMRMMLYIRKHFLKTAPNGWELLPSTVVVSNNLIAQGSYGNIRLGKAANNQDVVCKEIVVDGNAIKEEEVIREVKMMCACNHKNILKCYGCFFQPMGFRENSQLISKKKRGTKKNIKKNENEKQKSRIQDSVKNKNSKKKMATIVLEYCSYGDLFSYLQNEICSPEQKIKFLLEISIAIQYLHSNLGIVHRDIKPENVLLHPSYTSNGDRIWGIKICDFGASKLVKNINNTLCGTAIYLSPETAHEKKKIGDPKKLDIYSFGILMWVVWCQCQPFAKLLARYQSNPILFLMRVHDKDSPVRPNLKDADLVTAPKELIELMSMCWDPKPELRPDCDMLVYKLRDISNFINHPELVANEKEQLKFDDVESEIEEEDDELAKLNSEISRRNHGNIESVQKMESKDN